MVSIQPSPDPCLPGQTNATRAPFAPLSVIRVTGKVTVMIRVRVRVRIRFQTCIQARTNCDVYSGVYTI